jgi:hypothetical protein
MEAEYILQEQILSQTQNKIYLLFLPGPVSTPFVKIYSSWFQKYNIHLIDDMEEVKHFLQETPTNRVLNAALSHCVHHVSPEYSSLNTRPANTISIYEMLSGGKHKQLTASTKYVHSINNRFSHNYYSLPRGFKAIPPVRSGNIEKLLPEIVDNKVVILNIREHRANGSVGLSWLDFMPLIAYLKKHGFLVVDVSHEKKSFDKELEENGVICYWKLQNKSFFLDVELFSHADYYVGAGGISHLAYGMRIPSIWVGGLFPINIPSNHGYVLPCRLYDKTTGFAVSPDQSFGEYLNLRDPWEDGYDCWSKLWGSGNPFNCYEELSSRYLIVKPSAFSLVKTFQALVSNIMNNNNGFHVYPYCDIEGRAYIGSHITPYY